jgi:hypothetical protein
MFKLVINLIFNFGIQFLFIMLLANVLNIEKLNENKSKYTIIGIASGYQLLIMFIQAYTNILR